MSNDKQFRRWAFTYFIPTGEDEDAVTRDEISRQLTSKCNRWVFQLERSGEGGKLHFQGRASFKSAKRVCELKKVIPGAHWSVEHDTDAGDFYCTKEDETKVEGPWSDKDAKFPVPWDLAAITEWYPWQTDIFEGLKRRDDRSVNVLIDEKGCIGKSKVLKMTVWKKWGFCLPPIGDAKDMIQAVASMISTCGVRPAFLVDLPRTGESDIHMKSIYKAIECVKNGLVFDLRYKYTECVFDSPMVWVFTNQRPKRSWLSHDRWVYWRVHEGRLERIF